MAEALNASGVVTGAVNAEEHKALGSARRAVLCSNALFEVSESRGSGTARGGGTQTEEA